MTAIETELETDDALVALARAGDRRAFGLLVDRHAGALVAFARRRLDPDNAADATQAALARALESLSSLREPAAFKGWLYGIVLNECRRRRRSLRRFTRAVGRWLEGRSSVVMPAADDQTEDLRAAIARLPEKQRLAVELRIWEGLTCEQAALALGCTTGTIKANFHHALAKLRRDLEQSS